jgi:hypothetical protein
LNKLNSLDTYEQRKTAMAESGFLWVIICYEGL